MEKASLILITQAREDIFEAYSFYENEQPGLGDRLLATLDSCFDSIQKSPLTYRFFYEDVRGFVVPIFPYIILYRASRQQVQVVSIFHTARDPKPWQS